MVSCSTSNKIAALKPEPDDASPLVYETTASFINLPISVKLKDIENQTNTLMNGLIYEDNNIQDDNIEMKIYKVKPIVQVEIEYIQKWTLAHITQNMDDTHIRPFSRSALKVFV
jgi:hypothetical protein